MLILLVVLSDNTEAASQKKNALTAYAKFLSNPYNNVRMKGMTVSLAKNCYFDVVSIDSNDIPELVLYTPDSDHANGWGVLYTYKNGKWSTRGYFWNNKEISSSAFNKKLKKYIGKTKLTKFRFHENSSINRKLLCENR
ncbi:MAG: hypothetical protein ACI4EI_07365 [Muricoprocola sp.]